MLPVNQWTHIAATYDAFFTRYKIFVNGVLDTSSVIAGATPTTNSDSLYIGIAGALGAFSGQLDEVRLWRKVITDAEVYKYFRSSIGASTSVYTNLIMSFTFQNEDASGTLFSLHDWTENSNNGIGRNVSAVDYSNQLYTTIAHNECIELDGNDDYLESVDSLAFENAVTNYLTLQCWVYQRSGSLSTLISAPVSSFDWDFLLYINGNGEIEASVENTFYSSGTPGIIPLNKWTHVAFVLNEETGKFYINGKLIAVDTAGAVNLTLNADKLYVGGGPGAIADLNGFIDEIRISDIAASQSQLLQEMNMSLDKSFRSSPTYSEFAYNFDGILKDNLSDGGPRLEFRGNSKFSHPACTPNQPVSPLTRNDAVNFGKGFYIKRPDKRVPVSGLSGITADSLSINKNTSLNDVNLFVAMTHTNLSDITITLTGPGGNSVNVVSGIVAAGENDNLAAMFDDQSGNSITNGTYTSFTPAVKAQVNLNSAFAGSSSQGYWKIKITDNGAAADTGRLIAWGIQINNMAERESNLNLSALIQGFYNEPSNTMIKDSMRVYLWVNVLGFHLLDSSIALLNNQGEGLFSFKNSSQIDGLPFVVQLKHRNSIETWSNPLNSFVTLTGFEGTYDFRTDNSKAFGNNMMPVDVTPIRYAIYSGDVNQDGSVNALDISEIDNDVFNFSSGYIGSDVTGDNVTDAADLSVSDNNAFNFVSKITP